MAVATQIGASEADGILGLKGNQSELHEQVKAHFNYMAPYIGIKVF